MRYSTGYDNSNFFYDFFTFLYIWMKRKILIFPIDFVGNVLRQFRFITGIIVKTHMYICFIYNRIVVNIHARTLKLLYIFIWIQVALGQIASCKFFCSWVLDEIRTLKTRWTNRPIYIHVIINDESGVLEGPVQCTCTITMYIFVWIPLDTLYVE